LRISEFDSIVHSGPRLQLGIIAEAEMAKLKISVNNTRCIGSGDCVEMAPGVFQMDSDEKSEVYNQTGAADAVIIAAARACPARAITVVNEETGEQLFPVPKK
jgi:ferredoxin